MVRFAIILGLVLVPALCGCGDDPGDASDGGGDWSDPSATAGGVRSEAEILAALHGHLVDGASMNAEAWSEDARRVAEVLWPVVPGEPPAREAQVHLELTMVAGEVARWIGDSDEARVAHAKRSPIDVEIHDAFEDAVVTGPARYQVWVAGAGDALLKKLRDDRRRRFFGDD